MKRILLILALLLISCSQDIDTTVKDGNEGFVVGNGTIGVLLTHGLGASPYELKELSEYLASRDITVYAVRLDGHGTSYEDLNTKKWEDWYRNYKRAYDTIKPLKEKVFVGGISLGGIIALKLAEDEDVDGIIALAPALVLDDKRTDYAWLFKYFKKYNARTLPDEHVPYYYDRFPIAAIAEAVSFSKVVKKDLNRIDEPILIMHYSEDTRVNPESSQLVYDFVSSEVKDLRWLDGSGHVFILDDGNEEYFEAIYQFIISNI